MILNKQYYRNQSKYNCSIIYNNKKIIVSIRKMSITLNRPTNKIINIVFVEGQIR